MDGESIALIGCLDIQRAYVIGIAEGLSREALLTPVLPSGWTRLGLMNHLALGVERFWFHQVVAAEEIDTEVAGVELSAGEVSTDIPAEQIFERYRQEIERADLIIAATPFNTEPNAWPDFFGEWKLVDMRAVILHELHRDGLSCRSPRCSS